MKPWEIRTGIRYLLRKSQQKGIEIRQRTLTCGPGLSSKMFPCRKRA